MRRLSTLTAVFGLAALSHAPTAGAQAVGRDVTLGITLGESDELVEADAYTAPPRGMTVQQPGAGCASRG